MTRIGRVVLLTTVLAACGGDPLQPVIPNEVLVLTQKPRLEWYPAARFRGSLQVDEAGCLRLNAPAPDNATVVWPTGTTLWSGEGRFVIRNGFGRDVHIVGSPVTFEGGFLSTLQDVSELSRGERDSVQARCPGGYWLVRPGTLAAG